MKKKSKIQFFPANVPMSVYVILVVVLVANLVATYIMFKFFL